MQIGISAYSLLVSMQRTLGDRSADLVQNASLQQHRSVVIDPSDVIREEQIYSCGHLTMTRVNEVLLEVVAKQEGAIFNSPTRSAPPEC